MTNLMMGRRGQPPPQYQHHPALRCRAAVAMALAVFTLQSATKTTARAHTDPHPLSLFQPPAVALDPEITLSVVDPTTLLSSGLWVTVTWTGIEAWEFPDAFVAAFSPGTALDDPAHITQVAPVKYQFITAGGPLTELHEQGTEEAPGKLFLGHEDVSRDDEGMGEWVRAPRGGSEEARGVGPAGGAGARDAGGRDMIVQQGLRFRLLNLRDEEGYRFGLFKGGVTSPVLVAKTEEAVMFARPFEVRRTREGYPLIG